MELSHKHQVLLTITIVAVLFVIILFMMKPALKGYEIRKEFGSYDMTLDEILSKVEEKETKLNSALIRKRSCEKTSERQKERIEELTNESYQCSQLKNELKSEKDRKIQELENKLENSENKCNQEKVEVEREKEQLQKELDSLKKRFDALAGNAAENICCKHKVDYPETDSYIISNNKIACTTGEGNKLEC
ncbi:MAG: hypothetical protein ACQEP1_05580 [Nanobdellota archaeon]